MHTYDEYEVKRTFKGYWKNGKKNGLFEIKVNRHNHTSGKYCINVSFVNYINDEQTGILIDFNKFISCGKQPLYNIRINDIENNYTPIENEYTYYFNCNHFCFLWAPNNKIPTEPFNYMGLNNNECKCPVCSSVKEFKTVNCL